MRTDDGTLIVRGVFATREAADRAVEHLVQEHGVDPLAVVVAAGGEGNSSGTAPSGGDAAGAEEGSAFAARLDGGIEVSASVSQEIAAAAEGALREAGADKVGFG